VTKAAFLDEVRGARATLRASLAASDDRLLASAKVPGLDWTAKDVLAHLIGYDLAILAVLAEIRAGRPWGWPWTYPDFDPWNESQVGPRRDRPLATVRAELEQSRAALFGSSRAGPRTRARSDRTRGIRRRARSSGSPRTSASTPG
jgi:hypothetical protein